MFEIEQSVNYILQLKSEEDYNHKNFKMNQLRVAYLKDINGDKEISEVSFCLNKLEKHSLSFAPWSSYPYKPCVQFSIAHNNNCIFLKYYVTEKSIRAAAGQINGAVWEDACVEFFISFDNAGYYNLEFNCIGTMLIGFGKEKPTRKRLAEEVIREIRYQSIINSQTDNNVHWEITLLIPKEVFAHHQLSGLQGKQCRANFYKCGDALPDPHFLSWSDINFPKPNFHLPEFFGDLIFE